VIEHITAKINCRSQKLQILTSSYNRLETKSILLKKS